MADKYYVANNGLDTSSSWAATPYGAGGDGVPADGDDVYFQTLSGELSGGLTQFATTVPATITVGRGCNLFIASGSVMTIGDGTNTCTEFTYQGSGAQWAISVSAANAVDTVQINAPGTFTITKATEATALDNVYVDRGAVNFRGALKPNIYNFGGVVDIRGGGTIGVLDCLAGTATTKDTVTTLNCTGTARVTVDEDVSVTTANVNGGTLNLRSTGTTTTLNQKGGKVTPDGAIGTHTITTANLYGTNATTNFTTKVGLSEFSIGTTNSFGTVSPKSEDTSTSTGAGA